MGGGGEGGRGGNNRSNFSRRQFFLATLSIWLAKVRFVSVSIRRDLVVVTWFMFEPLTVRVGGAVGMLRFCLEPISVNPVLVTFRESLNVSIYIVVVYGAFFLQQQPCISSLSVCTSSSYPQNKTKWERERGLSSSFCRFFSSFTERIRMYTCYTKTVY